MSQAQRSVRFGRKKLAWKRTGRMGSGVERCVEIVRSYSSTYSGSTGWEAKSDLF